jgi:MarR family transcriptional regulator, 2-MHQ and catechol-resistance regulon repressor
MTTNEELLELYALVRRKISIVANSLLKETGLGTRQYIMLRALAKEGELTMTDLADQCMTDLATISRSLVQLQKSGLVEKNQSKEDGRIWIASLTKKGQAQISIINRVYSQLSQRCFAKLKAKEKKVLAQLLNQIVSQLSHSS